MDPSTSYTPPLQGSSEEMTASSTAALLKLEQDKNRKLLETIQCLEGRIKELEQQPYCGVTLAHQAYTLTQFGSSLAHGPDTWEHFCQFSLDAVIAEMKSLAPNLYHLFMQLGNTSCNVESHETSTEHIKAVMSLCALLNARSMRVKGIQLLLSLMLIERSTNQQVRLHA